MQMVCVVLNKTELLKDLLTNLKLIGVNGGTILDSQGMISYLHDSNESQLLDSIIHFLDQIRLDSKTMFFIVKEEQLDIIFETIDKTLGGIDNHHTGIAFSLPLGRVYGILK